jgi:hypothetical protein
VPGPKCRQLRRFRQRQQLCGYRQAGFHARQFTRLAVLCR